MYGQKSKLPTASFVNWDYLPDIDVEVLINNHIHIKVWNVITHPSPNFSYTPEVRTDKTIYIPRKCIV